MREGPDVTLDMIIFYGLAKHVIVDFSHEKRVEV